MNEKAESEAKRIAWIVVDQKKSSYIDKVMVVLVLMIPPSTRRSLGSPKSMTDVSSFE